MDWSKVGGIFRVSGVERFDGGLVFSACSLTERIHILQAFQRLLAAPLRIVFVYCNIHLLSTAIQSRSTSIHKYLLTELDPSTAPHTLHNTKRETKATS
jgi:hypothetical protein